MDNANPVYWPVTWPIYKFAFTGNASMTLLICVERFIFVVHPFKSKMWCSKKRTLLYICVATIISFILTIPYFFANTWDNDGKVKPTDFAIKYGHLGFCIEDFLIRFFLPNVTLITLSTIVAIKVSFILWYSGTFRIQSVHIFNIIVQMEKLSIKLLKRQLAFHVTYNKNHKHKSLGNVH